MHWILALALGCPGWLAPGPPHLIAQTPPDLAVVTLDGLPGVLRVLTPAPQRHAPMPPLPVTRLDDRGQAAPLDALRGLSLSFSRPLAVREVLLLLFRGTAFSIVVGPGVSGTFAGELKDVTLRQALESVLFPAGLDYDTDGTIVRVFPRRQQTRLFSVDHLNTPRAGIDFFADIAGGVQAILSGTGKSHVNRKAGLVQVTDFADRLDLVAAYLETAHLRVNRQVRVQARFFEIVRPIGSPIDWPQLAARPGSGIRRAAGTAAGWRVDDFDAWLRTIAETGTVRHIGAPSLLAMNNEPAVLRADDSAAEAEVRLTMTPQISADGVIQLHVSPTYLDGRRAVAGGADAATQFAASLDTVVRLADGDTMLVGGLLRTRDPTTLGELVVLLTAVVVTPTQLEEKSRE